MNPQNKGIYPNWVNDKDIINQVLNEILKHGGHLSYSFVINPEHTSETQARMKRILEKMLQEKLVDILKGEMDYLEINMEGSRAIAMGYRKYQRIKKWDGLRHSFGRIAYILFILFALILIAGIAYFTWRLVR